MKFISKQFNKEEFKNLLSTMWKVAKITITIFIEKSTFFRQSNVFTKGVIKELISRNFFFA